MLDSPVLIIGAGRFCSAGEDDNIEQLVGVFDAAEP
jgi:hypothetical protein